MKGRHQPRFQRLKLLHKNDEIWLIYASIKVRFFKINQIIESSNILLSFFGVS